MAKIDTNPEKIERLLTRGVNEAIDKDHLRQQLLSGKQLRVKLGIDPTSPDLHLGHTVVLRKLRQFQDLGHQAVLIIGDFTGRIGDPTSRHDSRKPLTKEQVEENLKNYKAQAGKILNLRRVKLQRNSKWFKKIDSLLKLATVATVDQVLQRADFKKRREDGNGIRLIEAFYPLFQGYDSVEIEADVELGGTDQKFNLLMGRQLQKYFREQGEYSKGEQDVLMTLLLVGLDGVDKMSKSKGNYIGLTEKPEEMFGKIMRIKDIDISFYVEACTDLDPLKDGFTGNNFKDQKMQLAHEIVKMYHSEKAAVAAKSAFEAQFSRGELPTEMPTIEIAEHAVVLTELLIKSGLVDSKSEARRLIEQGGVRINEVKKTDPAEAVAIDKDMVVQVGPRRFVKIVRK